MDLKSCIILLINKVSDKCINVFDVGSSNKTN